MFVRLSPCLHLVSTFSRHHRQFASVAKQSKPAVLPTEIAVHNQDELITEMDLTDLNVSTVYLDTYDPILRGMKSRLHTVNKDYVDNTISFLGWRNEAGKQAVRKIADLANEIDDVSSKLHSFCHQVNQASNDNFDKLFSNISSLSAKLQSEVVDKQKVAEELKDSKQRLQELKLAMTAVQTSLESTQKELSNQTAEYKQREIEMRCLQADLDNVMSKWTAEQKEVEALQQQMEQLNADNAESAKTYEDYMKKMRVSLLLYTALIGTAAAAMTYLMGQGKQENNNPAIVKGMTEQNEALAELVMQKEQQLAAIQGALDDVCKVKDKQIAELQEKLNEPSSGSGGWWSYIFG